MVDTNSVWSRTRATLSEAASLTQDLSVDVCVLGAGIAGLLTADALLDRGLSVAVLERASVGSGQTGLTTAHLTAVLDSRYYMLEREQGPEGAALTAESHTAAIAHIEQLSQRAGLLCEFERVDGYLYASDPSSESELSQEADAAIRAGLHVQAVEHIPLPFASGRALKFARQAQFHPMKLLAGLARRIESRGGRIFLQTHVDAIETGIPAIVHTQRGHQVRASSVVVATNTPINAIFSMHTKQAPYRTYALAAPVRRGVLPHGLYWDTEDPYHYVRMAQAPEAGLPADREWVIVGGEDHKVGQSDDPKSGWTMLEQWLRKRLPMVETPRYRWSGQVHEPADGLGFIGKSPGSENVFLITGHSGNGTTYGSLAALLLSDLVLGRENRWQHLYDPSRKPLGRSSLRRFAHENLNVARKYAEWLTPGNVDSVQEIPNGEGAVIRRGLKKIAVYVDPAGCAHERSAVCPHLGGVVHWNGAEKSWDCPCHGSRFDAYGHVLVGPAKQDLAGANEPARERVERPSHYRS